MCIRDRVVWLGELISQTRDTIWSDFYLIDKSPKPILRIRTSSKKSRSLTHIVIGAYVDCAFMYILVESANAYDCMETPSFERNVLVVSYHEWKYSRNAFHWSIACLIGNSMCQIN